MTEAELEALVEGIAPVIREHLNLAKQRITELALEIDTVRDVLLTQGRAAEGRRTELEMRCQALEARVVELEASAATVRS